jgi:tetratricopeptide (TPR) repeat protein
LNWQARYPDAMEIYNSMLKVAEENGDLVAQSRALQSLATSIGNQGDHRASLENAIRAEAFARTANAQPELARALWMQGSARFRLGEAQAASSLAEQSLAIFETLNNQNEVARCLNLIAAVHYVSGRFDKAENYWENALKIFQDLGNRQQGMDLLSNLGGIADARGDYETAFQRYDRALEIARETGYRDGEIVFLTNRGSELVALRRYEEAINDLRLAIRLAGINGSWCMSLTFNFHAEALIGLGKYEEAFYSARQALVLAEEDKTPEFIGMAWRTLGMLSDRINNVVRFSDWETHQISDHDAEACFSRSVKIFADAEIEMDRARSLRAWAQHEFRQGNRERGTGMWQEARGIFAKLGAQLEVDRMNSLPE